MKYKLFLFIALASILFAFAGCGEVACDLCDADTSSSSGVGSNRNNIAITGLSAYNGKNGMVLVFSMIGESLDEFHVGAAAVTGGKLTTDILEYDMATLAFGDPWTGSGEYLLALRFSAELGNSQTFLYTNGRDINCSELAIMYTYSFSNTSKTVDFSKFKEFDSTTCEGLDF